MKKENTTSVAIVATKNNIETVKVEQTNKPTADKATPVAPAPPATPTAKAMAAPAKKVEPTPTPDSVKMQAETVLKLSKRIKELEEQLRKEPQSIEERIEYYKRKQQLTERYQNLNAQIQHLEKLREQVEACNDEVEDFTNDANTYRLRLMIPSSQYNEKDVINISNVPLINEVINLLVAKMHDKAESLQNEIAA